MNLNKILGKDEEVSNIDLKFHLTLTQNNRSYNLSLNNLFNKLVIEHKIPMTSLLELLFSELLNVNENEVLKNVTLNNELPLKENSIPNLEQKEQEPIKEIEQTKQIVENTNNPKFDFPELLKEKVGFEFQKYHFDNINKVIDYFFEKIPSSGKVDTARNLKQIQLLLDRDTANIKEIMQVIDFIASDKELRKSINRPYLLRVNYKEVLKLKGEKIK